MVLIAFFTFSAYCSVIKSIMYSSALYLRLRSFGFEKDATFTINITTPNITKLIIFLVAEKNIFLRPNTEMEISTACAKNPPYVSDLNSSLFKPSTSVSWTGSIKETNVYYPYVVNCNKNSTIYKIVTDFRNPFSHLDFRDNNYSILCTFISFLYTIITIIWIANGILHPKFWIPLHSGFAFVSSTKAVVCSLESKMWENRKLGIINYAENGSLHSFFIILHYTSFLSFPIFAMAGWCIFRDSMPLSEFLRIILCNLILVFGFWPSKYITSLKEVALSVVLLSIGSIVFLRIITDYIIMLSNLEERISDGQQVLKRKVSLVTRFTSSFFFFGLSYSIFYILSISFNLWDILGDIIIELGFVILSFIELYFFLIRQSYEGKEDEIGRDLRKEDMDVDSSIYHLEEPKVHDIAIISIRNH